MEYVILDNIDDFIQDCKKCLIISYIGLAMMICLLAVNIIGVIFLATVKFSAYVYGMSSGVIIMLMIKTIKQIIDEHKEYKNLCKKKAHQDKILSENK